MQAEHVPDKPYAVPIGGMVASCGALVPTGYALPGDSRPKTDKLWKEWDAAGGNPLVDDPADPSNQYLIPDCAGRVLAHLGGTGLTNIGDTVGGEAAALVAGEIPKLTVSAVSEAANSTIPDGNYIASHEGQFAGNGTIVQLGSSVGNDSPSAVSRMQPTLAVRYMIRVN